MGKAIKVAQIAANLMDGLIFLNADALLQWCER
jgi:hypothetical protein